MSSSMRPHEEDLKFRDLIHFISFDYIDDEEMFEDEEEEILYEVQTDIGRSEQSEVNMNFEYHYHTIAYLKYKNKVKEKLMWLEPNKIAFIDDKVNYKIITFDEAINKVVEWNKTVAKIKNFK